MPQVYYNIELSRRTFPEDNSNVINMRQKVTMPFYPLPNFMITFDNVEPELVEAVGYSVFDQTYVAWLRGHYEPFFGHGDNDQSWNLFAENVANYEAQGWVHNDSLPEL